MFVAAYNCFALPIEIAFKSPVLLSPTMMVINYFMDVVFMLDMIVVFRTSIFLEDTEIWHCKKVSKHYLEGRFTVDLVSTIPFELILSWFLERNQADRFKLLSLFKLIRMLRLSHIITVMNLHKDAKLIFKLFKLFFFLLMYIHCLTCLWWFEVQQEGIWIAPMNGIDSSKIVKEMLPQLNLYSTEQQGRLYQYAFSFYSTLLYILGNDLFPRTSR